jgi:hypothetical protein
MDLESFWLPWQFPAEPYRTLKVKSQYFLVKNMKKFQARRPKAFLFTLFTRRTLP